MIRLGQGGPSGRGGSRTVVQAARHNGRLPLGLIGRERARAHGGWKAFGSSDDVAPFGPERLVEQATVEASQARGKPSTCRYFDAPFAPVAEADWGEHGDRGKNQFACACWNTRTCRRAVSVTNR